MDGRSQIEVHTDERTQVHSARSSLTVFHPRSTLHNLSERATELALVATVSLLLLYRPVRIKGLVDLSKYIFIIESCTEHKQNIVTIMVQRRRAVHHNKCE